MPVILLERLPLPSLKAYTVISAVLLSCSVYYAVHVTSDPSWKNNSTSVINIETLEAVKNESYDVGGLSKKLSSLGVFITDIVTFMIQEPLCIWITQWKMHGLLEMSSKTSFKAFLLQRR
uniref:Uncharacterized protein n=1 Tax=Graphocephala atropunctata TaxID=36148 RepID=A0A1B6KF14_9HEMI